VTDEEYAAKLALVGKLRQRASPRNEHASARIRGFTEGLTGEENPSGALDNPQYAEDARAGFNAGNWTSLASDSPVGPTGVAAGLGKAALYAGALRKNLQAVTSHSVQGLTDPSGKLVRELYHPSFGISSDELKDFAEEGTMLIPRLGKFDPKTENTVLTGIDAWTPRHQSAAGKRIDSISPANLNLPDYKALIAEARLADKFYPNFPLGGIGAESHLKSRNVAHILPHYGEIDPADKQMMLAKALRTQTRAADMMNKMRFYAVGPRFQSFKHYETSPVGAARLDGGRADYFAKDEALSFVNYLAREGTGELVDDIDKLVPALKDLVKLGGNVGKGAASHLSDLRKTMSEYGELKAFGPVGVNAENFAGLILPPDYDRTQHGKDMVNALRAGAEKRGIQTYTPPSLIHPQTGGPMSIDDAEYFEDYVAAYHDLIKKHNLTAARQMQEAAK